MAYWRVRGVFKNEHYCDCEHCLGHGLEEVRIDTVVEAADENLAELIALMRAGCEWESDEDREERWMSGPVTEELPQDQLMRHLGQPEFPLVDDLRGGRK